MSDTSADPVLQPSLPLEPTPVAAEPPATPEPREPAPPAEQTEEEEQKAAQSREDRRIAALTAKLSAAQRERDRQAQELNYWREQATRAPQQPGSPGAPDPTRDAQIFAQAEAKIRAERFHEEGQTAYGDWGQKCQDLISMGADPGFAQLLVETPGGVRIAAALAEDPAEVQRIAGLTSERARAVALGRYAATLESSPAARAAPAVAAAPVTRAPAPIRPVRGRANPVFDEYNASGQELADHYMRQVIENQRRR